MQNTCEICRTKNDASAYACKRCSATLVRSLSPDQTEHQRGARLGQRISAVILVCIALLAGFYMSLIMSAQKLTIREREQVTSAIALLEEKGFTREVFLLRHLTAYRSNDNWLNASVSKENAYAATNFPFEIMTLYPDFFSYPADDTERAAILLHEAKHLQGKDEKTAYEFVWKNREKLGWTQEKYFRSTVWEAVRMQTRENVPELFTCPENQFLDCTARARR